MKLFFLAVLFIVACAQHSESASPSSASPPPPNVSPGSPAYRECNDIAMQGWEIDFNACTLHLSDPRYKRGQVVKFNKNSHYHSSCRFQVESPRWHIVENKPAYSGLTTCPPLVGQKPEIALLEEELR